MATNWGTAQYRKVCVNQSCGFPISHPLTHLCPTCQCPQYTARYCTQCYYPIPNHYIRCPYCHHFQNEPPNWKPCVLCGFLIPIQDNQCKQCFVHQDIASLRSSSFKKCVNGMCQRPLIFDLNLCYSCKVQQSLTDVTIVPHHQIPWRNALVLQFFIDQSHDRPMTQQTSPNVEGNFEHKQNETRSRLNDNAEINSGAPMPQHQNVAAETRSDCRSDEKKLVLAEQQIEAGKLSNDVEDWVNIDRTSCATETIDVETKNLESDGPATVGDPTINNNSLSNENDCDIGKSKSGMPNQLESGNQEEDSTNNPENENENTNKPSVHGEGVNKDKSCNVTESTSGENIDDFKQTERESHSGTADKSGKGDNNENTNMSTGNPENENTNKSLGHVSLADKPTDNMSSSVQGDSINRSIKIDHPLAPISNLEEENNSASENFV